MSDTRVVVTGIGMVTPFGCGRELSWMRIVSGSSATRQISDRDPAQACLFASRKENATVATRVENWIGAPGPLGNETASDPVVEMALRCAAEAIADAGLPLCDIDRDRIGCVIGTSKPLLRTFAESWCTALQAARCANNDRSTHNGPTEVGTPTSHPTEFWPNEPAVAVAREYRLGGPCLCPVAACATGLVSLQRGVDLIRDGHCDTVLAGSSDASFLPIVLGSFKRLGVLARNGDDPATACRPFDRNRSGFVIGEGAAVLVLERLDDAIGRGATIYAEWLAGGMASDGGTLTGLADSGEALARLIRDVLRRAELRPEDIDYINLHGTATEQNDVYETRAVKRAFGSAATSVQCSSLKGAIGHLLGAAGSVETAATLLAMRDGVIPPTVNLSDPDPECDLDYTPIRAVRQPLRTAMKVSLGFGGHLAVGVVRRI